MAPTRTRHQSYRLDTDHLFQQRHLRAGEDAISTMRILSHTQGDDDRHTRSAQGAIGESEASTKPHFIRPVTVLNELRGGVNSQGLTRWPFVSTSDSLRTILRDRPIQRGVPTPVVPGRAGAFPDRRTLNYISVGSMVARRRVAALSAVCARLSRSSSNSSSRLTLPARLSIVSTSRGCSRAERNISRTSSN